ncbi:hypothetical protein F511_29628 [Dorcoceras hygrometricum]|uniref:Uncharacterized protein n=1 Tax=Dorcoceras hygrometricum TaxID=472368 RepID=A0A2Z7CD46_9LAMI|nr:hypothetical protein F511_29628 [Dorcoceras hygrometricum]
MAIEFRLLCDILAKTISVKAGSFDSITQKKFLMVAAIICAVRINWNRLLFKIFKDKVTPGQGKPKDPNKTKAGNKYEVKPQYEELSKQINTQHAINQCYECMRQSKEISQLDRCNNCPSQLGDRHSYPVVTAPTIALDFSGTTQQSASHNVAPKSDYQIKSVNQARDALTTKNRAQITRNSHPQAQKKQLLNLLHETNNSRMSRAYGISQLVAPSFQTSINGKSKSQGVQRHQERQKQRLDAMEIGGGKLR